MRIVEVRVDAVAAPFPRPLFYQARPLVMNTAVVVHLEDSNGAVGFGYTPTFGFATSALRSLVQEDFGPLLVGVEIDDVRDGIARLRGAVSIAGRPAGLAQQGAALLEMAAWDVAGQLAGRPLHALWSQPTAQVRAYASGGWRHLPVEDLVRMARDWVDAGFCAVKVQAGLSPDEDAARLRLVRDAVGPDVEVMVDANQRFPKSDAAAWAAALEPYHPAWLEEPIPAEEHAVLARLRAAVDYPIAAGESESEASGLNDLLDLEAVDVIQPDIYRAGLETTRSIRARASDLGTAVAPHMAHEISAHLMSGDDGRGWLEYFDWFDDWWVVPTLPDAGCVTPSTTPGHGLALRPGWLESHRI